MRSFMIFAISALSLTSAAPVLAQDAMMKDAMKKDAMAPMSTAASRRVATCNAMSDEARMRSVSCRRLARKHANAMQHDGMMKNEGAMAHDSMMKAGH